MYVEGDLPVLTTGGNNGGNGGFGYGNDAWVLIILFALIFGWNRNGFGGNNGGGSDGIGSNYVLATDFATIERKLDSLSNGICDSTYALNNTIVNGNAAIQQTLTQGFNGVNLGLTTQGYETRNAIAGVSSQLAQCCCDIRTNLGELKYANAINTRDLIENQNANYRALHDEIVANRIEDKNAQIAAQQNEINALRLKASQEAQNAYLLNELKPCPKAAYVVQPSQPVTFPTNCCGTASYANFSNSGCGCGL